MFTRKIPMSGNGLIVAFVGQDGAGKSTVTQDIVKWMNWKIEARRFYLGSGDHYHSVFKMLRKKYEKKRGYAKKIASVCHILDLLKLSFHYKKVVRKAFLYVEKGGVAVFDRYVQNQFAGINDGPKIRSIYNNKTINKSIRAILNLLAFIEERNIQYATKYSPDVVFKLVLAPEESKRRKPEEEMDVIIKKHQIIQKLEFPNSKVYRIDAQMEYEDEILLIKKRIWSELQAKASCMI